MQKPAGDSERPEFPRTMADSVGELLRASIVRGDFAPGERIPIGMLSERFGVSTMPIRGALQLLEREGLVVTTPHRGSTVASLTVAEIEDIYEMRALLEPVAIRTAIGNMTEADLSRIDYSVRQMNEATDPVEMVEWNNRFHMALYRPSWRRHLVEVIYNLRVRVQHYVPFYDLAELEEAKRDHDDLVVACRAQDLNEAVRITVEHLLAAAKKICAAVEAREGTGRALES